MLGFIPSGFDNHRVGVLESGFKQVCAAPLRRTPAGEDYADANAAAPELSTQFT